MSYLVKSNPSVSLNELFTRSLKTVNVLCNLPYIGKFFQKFIQRNMPRVWPYWWTGITGNALFHWFASSDWREMRDPKFIVPSQGIFSKTVSCGRRPNYLVPKARHGRNSRRSLGATSMLLHGWLFPRSRSCCCTKGPYTRSNRQTSTRYKHDIFLSNDMFGKYRKARNASRRLPCPLRPFWGRDIWLRIIFVIRHTCD